MSASQLLVTSTAGKLSSSLLLTPMLRRRCCDADAATPMLRRRCLLLTPIFLPKIGLFPAESRTYSLRRNPLFWGYATSTFGPRVGLHNNEIRLLTLDVLLTLEVLGGNVDALPTPVPCRRRLFPRKSDFFLPKVRNFDLGTSNLWSRNLATTRRGQ